MLSVFSSVHWKGQSGEEYTIPVVFGELTIGWNRTELISYESFLSARDCIFLVMTSLLDAALLSSTTVCNGEKLWL